MEIETRVTSEILKTGTRSKYNFEVENINYDKDEVEEFAHEQTEPMNFSRMEKEGIKLESQVIQTEKGTTFESLSGGITREKNYLIEYGTRSIDDIIDKIFDEFEMRDREGKVLQLGEHQYTQNDLPPREKIKDIITKSMQRVGIKGDQLIDKNRNKILQAFGTLLRKKGKTVVAKLKVNDPYIIQTTKIEKESIGIGSIRKESTIFLTNDYENDCSIDQNMIIGNLLGDDSLPRSATKEINEFLFKTPLNIVLTKAGPERSFVEHLCKQDVAEKIDARIKSRDRGFYSIEYSIRYGDKDSNTRKYNSNKNFNPDFFIKVTNGDYTLFVVVEIKADQDDSDENKAKYKYALEHFERLNQKIADAGKKEKYIFHFLSPNGYTQFFEYLKNGTLLEGQDKFRCELENMLED
ncbi:MAG TPA: hypothetical protein PLW93_03725 [Candidatus Absconditabacterales bacterium]|nr:hypothetical protein [Candidatus Absconditabacterales bacterium]